MKYDCDIIKDLLPLYIEKIASKSSQKIIKEHLRECKCCKSCFDAMCSGENTLEINELSKDDKTMLGGLKNLKRGLQKKIRRTIIIAVGTALLFTFGFHTLTNSAFKEVDPSNVSVMAEVYQVDDLPANINISDDSVILTQEENDAYTHSIEVSNIENTNNEPESVSIIKVFSQYNIKNIEQEIKDKTLYITAFKTSLLMNKNKNNYSQTHTHLEFSEINKIIFINKDKSETTLWEK